MSDANAKGRWVTDAGDERAGSFTCCGEHLKTPHNIPSPFYEGQTRYYVYCPACALAHFGVRPPGTPDGREIAYERDGELTICPMCGGSAARNGGFACARCYGSNWTDQRNHWLSLQHMTEQDRRAAMRDWFYRRGVDLRAAGKMLALTTAAPPPAIDIDPEHYAGPARCHLDWCSAPTHSTFCSSNCERAHEDRIAAVARREAFVARMRRRDDGWGVTAAVKGEIEWAKGRADEEVEAIRRAWSALRHAAAEGSEGAFAGGEEE